jgi:hypothetical protein
MYNDYSLPTGYKVKTPILIFFNIFNHLIGVLTYFKKFISQMKTGSSSSKYKYLKYVNLIIEQNKLVTRGAK